MFTLLWKASKLPDLAYRMMAFSSGEVAVGSCDVGIVVPNLLSVLLADMTLFAGLTATKV